MVEKFRERRYFAVLLQAVALLDIFVETLMAYLSSWTEVTPFHVISGWVGIPLLLAASVWYLVLYLKIRRNAELRTILNDEVYIYNKYRSQRLALWLTMASLFVCMLLYAEVSAFIVCEMSILFGFSALKTSWLIYNR